MRITTNATEIASTFRTYVAINGRNPIELLKKQSIQLVIGSKGYPGLYQLTKEGAPTWGQIRGDVLRQGWKIPVTFPDGRTGRGTPEQWAGVKIKALPVRLGRPTKARVAEIAAIKAAKPTLEDMQRFVIAKRIRAIFYVATGWGGAAADLGGSFEGGELISKKKRGYAESEVNGDAVSISVVNDTPGILYVNRKTNLAVRALKARVDDMKLYIRRKQKEAAQNVGWKVAA